METHRRTRGRAMLAGAVAAITIVGALPASASAGPVDDLVNGLGLNEVIGGGSVADTPGGGDGASGSAPKAHAQGTVAAVDVNPGQDGFLAGEEVVVGRSRAEQGSDGNYKGKITILGLLGMEILGVETDEGQIARSPLQPVQNILDGVCDGSGGSVCLKVLVSDSKSDNAGSSNDFAVARADVKLGDESISAGAAESSGTLQESGNCQTATASSSLARADVLGLINARVLQSFVQSVACTGAAGSQSNDSTLLSLNGNGIPLPGGCENGTTDAGFGILGLVSVSCNADESSGSGGSRGTVGVEALGENPAVASATAPEAESAAAAPAPGGSVNPGTPANNDGAGGPAGEQGSGDPAGDDGAGSGSVAGQAQTGGGELAFTGSNLALLGLIGLGLIAVGTAVAMRRRPRRIGVSL